jgi:hypothetical protein
VGADLGIGLFGSAAHSRNNRAGLSSSQRGFTENDTGVQTNAPDLRRLQPGFQEVVAPAGITTLRQNPALRQLRLPTEAPDGLNLFSKPLQVEGWDVVELGLKELVKSSLDQKELSTRAEVHLRAIATRKPVVQVPATATAGKVKPAPATNNFQGLPI